MAKIVVDTATIAETVAKQGRVNRNPEHSFNLSVLPYAIQPFMIAPVLPGETMKNALLQARAISDPIASDNIGWHSEWYVFYVKLRDLDIRDDLTNMLLVPGGAVPEWAHANGFRDMHCYNADHGVNYTRLCLDRVTAEYFRDEGDNPAFVDAPITASAGPGLPPATFMTKERWMDSAKLESAVPAGDDGELDIGNEFSDFGVPPEYASHFEQYQRMRALKLTEVTFADWLAQFGIKAPREIREDLHRPELLRYVRDWTYPANTVDPTTGVPNSVVSWAIAERLDKARFFNEPGFIFGVTVYRPKVYLGRQHQAAVEMLTTAQSWLPALLNGDPYTSLRRFAVTDGPLGHESAEYRPTEAYWVDMRDLFLYGDQFTNNWERTDAFNSIARPSANLERRYLSTAEIKALFKDANKSRIRIDGVMQLTIAGHQRDYT